MEYIKRDIYLQKLIDSRLNGDVKVVTGPRRCGKSWLLTRLYKDYLIEDGHKTQNFSERYPSGTDRASAREAGSDPPAWRPSSARSASTNNPDRSSD